MPRPRPRETHRGHTTLSSQSVVSSARHHARRRSRICSHCRHARAATQSKQYSQHAQTSEDGEPLTANKYGCCMHSRSPLSPPRTRCSPRACALALDPRHASLSHSVTPSPNPWWEPRREALAAREKTRRRAATQRLGRCPPCDRPAGRGTISTHPAGCQRQPLLPCCTLRGPHACAPYKTGVAAGGVDRA